MLHHACEDGTTELGTLKGIPIKAEVAQLALMDGDLKHNLNKVLEAIGRADVAGGTQLIVFPETTLSRFPTRDNIATIAQPLDGPVHQRAIAARAMENQVFVLMTNRCGRGDLQLSFPGQSALVDPSGEFLVVAGAGETQLAVQLDLSRLESSRRQYQYVHEARVALKLQPVASARGTAALLIELPGP